jgi:nucleoside-diphosphate-sugar epimerase
MTTVCLRLPAVMDFQSDKVLRWRKRMLQHAREWKSADFWAYLDLRDAARAFRLALENDLEGAHVLLVAARDSFVQGDVRDLVQQHYPALAHCVETLEPHASLYNTRQAQEVLGFTAQHSWREVPELMEGG